MAHSKLKMGWYKFFIDTCSMLFFTTITGLIVELGIAKLTLMQSLASRIMWILPNLVTGGIYAQYMDWWRWLLNTKSILIHAVSDILAFLTFQTPIYILILIISGADYSQILKATGSITLMAPVLGVTAGWFVSWIRKLCHVKG